MSAPRRTNERILLNRLILELKHCVCNLRPRAHSIIRKPNLSKIQSFMSFGDYFDREFKVDGIIFLVAN